MRVLLTVLLVGATLLKEASTEEGEEGAAVEVPVVYTNTGPVSGVLEKSTHGNTFYSYYSIPFAKPPVGPLRFKDPQMVREWMNVREGTSPPPLCPQVPFHSLLTGMNLKVQGEEDCLYLNVFTPKPRDKAPLLPVMVFIHGGAWITGGSQEYPPHVLLNHDIVLVTIQYRLGTLGFMSTEDEAAPGNLGLKDQAMALGWVQKNAHKFGGDPLSITLFGESAGAGSVHLQILSPKTIGLFKRAILQSGTAMSPWSLGTAHSQVAEYTGALFNCSAEHGSERLISCLQAMDAHQLALVPLHFQEWQTFPLLLGPRVDGQYLPDDPNTLMKNARHKRVDLMTGVTQHEGAIVSLPMYGNEMYRSALKYNFPSIGPVSLQFRSDDVAPLNQTIMIYDHYLGGLHLDRDHADNLTQMFSDRLFVLGHDLTSAYHAANLARSKNTTFRYELRHRGQHSLGDFYPLNIGRDWISHMDDLFYLFEGGPLWKPLTEEVDLKLRDTMTTLWTNFAATGNPTPDDSLGFKWEPVTKGDLRYLALQPSPAMEEDYRKETRDFWFSLPLKQNLVLHPERVKNLVFSPVEEPEATTATSHFGESAQVEPPPQHPTEGTATHQEKEETEEKTSNKDEL